MVKPVRRNFLEKMRARKLKEADSGAPHLFVYARAGTGKTTTIVEGYHHLFGMPTNVSPSEQQRAIWEAMADGDKVGNVCMVSLGTAIVGELRERVPAGVRVSTLHALGWNVLCRKLPDLDLEVDKRAVYMTMDECIPHLRDKVVKGTVAQATRICKQAMLGEIEGDQVIVTPDVIEEVVAFHDLDYGSSDADKIATYVSLLMTHAMAIPNHQRIDFADQLWLPIVLGLEFTRYDLLCVDEAQDLNRAQQEICLRAGRRIMVCGDQRQAIYGFAGADTRSMDRLKEILSDTPRGVEEYGLTTTYRCARSIVVEANKVEPDFFARDDAPEGVVATRSFLPQTLRCNNCEGTGVLPINMEVITPCPECRGGYTIDEWMPGPGDLILSRVNAPLVHLFFWVVKQNLGCKILGRNIGEGLVTIAEKLTFPGQTKEQFAQALDLWATGEVEKEESKKKPKLYVIGMIRDKARAIFALLEHVEHPIQLMMNIRAMFGDGVTDDEVVRLSTIHKAKGLEADRVWILNTDEAPLCSPYGSPSEELNLRYVAVTRAKYQLTFLI